MAEVDKEGVFDREISEAEIRVAETPGFRDFDPSTSVGRECWRQLRELFEAYFSHFTCCMGTETKGEMEEDQAAVSVAFYSF